MAETAPLTVLIYAEDPGAALYMRALPQALRQCGAEVRIMADHFAAPYFVGEDLTPILPDADRALAQSNADVLIVGTSENPDTYAFKLIDAARRTGMPSFGAVDSPPNAENRFRGHSEDPLHYAPDYLLLPDDETAQNFQRLGFDPQAITVCGHPRMDEIAAIRAAWRDEDRRSQRQVLCSGLADDRRIIVFVSELSVGLGDRPFRRNADYRLGGTSNSDARSRIIAEELVLAARSLADDPFLVLRLHPKQNIADETDVARLFDAISQQQAGLEVVNAADLVVGMTSILLAEAAALGRPVLSIVPLPEEREWLGSAGADIPCVWDRDALGEFLTRPWPHVKTQTNLVGAAYTMALQICAILKDRQS